jgi:hypothetical protein
LLQLTLVSCKQETKDQVGEATDAIGTEMGDMTQQLLKLMQQILLG